MKDGIYINSDGEIALVYKKQDMPFNNFEVMAKSFYIELEGGVLKQRLRKQEQYLRKHGFSRFAPIPKGVPSTLHILRGF